MAGCRSLSESEVSKVLEALSNPRDKALFILGCKTGFRISELLSLVVSDVYQGQVLDRIRVQKSNIKGKTAGREVVLHPMAKAAILALIQSMGAISGDMPLFKSRNGSVALSRHGAHKVLKLAYAKAGLRGNGLSTHTMRKSFARKVYSNLKFDLLATRDALGHSSITNTVKYLEVNQIAIDAAVLAA